MIAINSRITRIGPMCFVDDNRICLTRLCQQDKDKQVEILNRLLEGRKEILVRKIDRSTRPLYTAEGKRARYNRTYLTQLAL